MDSSASDEEAASSSGASVAEHVFKGLFWPGGAGGLARPRFLLSEAQVQLASIEALLRTRLYSEFCERCAELAPYLRAQGQRVGQRMLARLLLPFTEKPTGGLLYLTALRDLALEAEVRASAAEAAATSRRMARLQPLLRPVLEPFTEGLQQPFQDVMMHIKRHLALGAAAVALVSGVVGFLVGRYCRPRCGTDKR